MALKKYVIYATQSIDWEWPIIEAEDASAAQDIANDDWSIAKNIKCECIEMVAEEAEKTNG